MQKNGYVKTKTLQSSGFWSNHRFIATALFRMVQDPTQR